MAPVPGIPQHLIEDAQGKWNQFCASANQRHISLPDSNDFIDQAHKVFAFSDFIAKASIRDPQILDNLVNTQDLQQKSLPESYRNKLQQVIGELMKAPGSEEISHPESIIREQISGLQPILRRFRMREMIRIGWRDLTGWADLSETMRDLSWLADVCIDQSLALLYTLFCALFGTPTAKDGSQQFLTVIGMGKLGGFELNFSSDVDLIFAYPETGHTQGKPAPIGNDEFFARLCRALIRVLGELTQEGFVFRMDTRLRPDGENGPIVVSFDSMEQYYQYQGREWERYAWIKARIVAGDKRAGEGLLKRLKPFIYRRYLDYGVFESLRDMKHNVSLEVKRRGMDRNIKLGSGGIREIEFFGQIFQLLRGGVVPALQQRSIQSVLQTLVHEKFISQQTCRELTQAYKFLRTTENRLQEFADQQTHTLPNDSLNSLRLAASMNFEDWKSFAVRLRHHRDTVHAHFEGLLESGKAVAPVDDAEEDEMGGLAGVWQDSIEPAQGQQLLRCVGFENPENIFALLDNLKNTPETRALSPTGRNRLDRLIPHVLQEVGRSENPSLVMKRVVDLLQAVERRTTYIALLLENPAALKHLVRLVSASSWIASYLARHPVLLDELLDPRTLYVPTEKRLLQKELRQRLKRVAPDDLEYQIEELCIFKQINTLRAAAADVSGVLPLMRVSDYLSYIAEAVLDEVVELSWNHLIRKHGHPICHLNQQSSDKGFAIIAYGKLGGLELSYSSDLDLVFLHAGARGLTQGGPNPIESSQFFARLGQRVIRILATHTAAGVLYETDMRLRPSGSSGVLVSHYQTFKEYQLTDAWTWEHQALLRARAILGDKQLIHWFEQTRKEVLTRYRDKLNLKAKVVDMRNRLRKEQGSPDSNSFDLKQGCGGMVDIEFLVQYLILLTSHEYHKLVKWTDNVRLLNSLSRANILDEKTAYFLRMAYLIYRAYAHRLSLEEKPALVSRDKFQELRHKVTGLWKSYLG